MERGAFFFHYCKSDMQFFLFQFKICVRYFNGKISASRLLMLEIIDEGEMSKMTFEERIFEM